MRTIPLGHFNRNAELTMIAVCAHFGLRPTDITGPSRRWSVVWPRWVFIHLVKQSTGCSTNELGERLNRDHTTIIYSLSALRNLVDTDRRAAEEFARVEAKVRAITNDIYGREDAQMPLPLFAVA